MHPLVRGTIVFVILSFLFLGSATAQEWNESRIREVAASLHEELGDPFEKVQLANDIRWYYEWRVRLAPSDYEKGEDFQKKFKAAFSIFVTSLFTREFRGAEKRLQQQAVSTMVQSYSKNRDRFIQFYTRMGEANPYYKRLPQVRMERKIIQFAIIVNEAGDKILLDVFKFTGIYPFC